MNILYAVKKNISGLFSNAICVCTKQECPFIHYIITFHIQYRVAFGRSRACCASNSACLKIKPFFKYFWEDKISRAIYNGKPDGINRSLS